MNPIQSFIRRIHTKKLYASLIQKNDLCFDIGANAGKKSIIFLSLGARVIGFEPQSTCLPALARVAKKYPDFSYRNIAVGDTTGLAELHLGTHTEIATLSNKFMDYFRTAEVYWNKKETVQVKTLNNLVEEYGLPNYCKIDVEGYEEKVLGVLTYQIPLIEFEYTGGFIRETTSILDRLSGIGDYRFNYSSNEKSRLRLKNWIPSEEMAAIILSLSRNRLHGNIFAKLIL
ncbi:MAG TPA: FkbM family methyltransferase [Eudoraea sp.]|nr:FkbM family methyltransferase [Eudoraea sp.]